ncbi:MAG: short chain dehydrogenase family protein [Burkholderiales bacterium]|jgi:short-subunit dehydrogenase|nr:short chain dehydrogenase family protein [Burkholderiales bacterium]
MKRYRAVLTGASGGIGRAIAAALAPHCEELLLVGRDAARLAEAAALAGPVARTRVADLSTPGGRDSVGLPGMDLLINNAGAGDFGWLEGQNDATLERIVETNVLAPMQLTRRLLPELARRDAAWIVNVGSIMGYLGYPGQAAYCASKFALRGFSEALRRELADGPVRVLYLAPRATRTAMNGAGLCALNAELGVAMDEPAIVARELIELLRRPARERLLGMPERLFARLNQLVPGLVDRALRRQLPAIRRHVAKGDIP